MDRSYIRRLRTYGQMPGKMSHEDEKGFSIFGNQRSKIENQKSKISNGFTMLEVLAAIAILAITVVPLVGLLSTAITIHVQREQETRAAFLAQLKLEEIKNIVTLDFGSDYNKPAGDATDFPAPNSRFRYTVTDNVDPDIKDITVRVWCDKDGNGTPDVDEQAVQLDTKIARRL